MTLVLNMNFNLTFLILTLTSTFNLQIHKCKFKNVPFYKSIQQKLSFVRDWSCGLSPYHNTFRYHQICTKATDEDILYMYDTNVHITQSNIMPVTTGVIYHNINDIVELYVCCIRYIHTTYLCRYVRGVALSVCVQRHLYAIQLNVCIYARVGGGISSKFLSVYCKLCSLQQLSRSRYVYCVSYGAQENLRTSPVLLASSHPSKDSLDCYSTATNEANEKL